MADAQLDVKTLLVCPECKIALTDEQKMHFRCSSCGRDFVGEGQVPCFLLDASADNSDLSSKDGVAMVRGYRNPSRVVACIRKVVSSHFWPGKEWKRAKNRVVRAAGPVLVIGSGVTRYSGAVHLDLDDFPGVDVIGDAQALPFRDGCFESVCCEVVLEHVADHRAVISETHRVLRPGGICFFIVPFVFPYHGHPGDYRRWTRQGIEKEFAEFDQVEVGIHGGPCSAMVNLISEWFYVMTGLRYPKAYVPIKGLATALFFPLKYFDLFANRHPEAHRLAATLYVLAQK